MYFCGIPILLWFYNMADKKYKIGMYGGKFLPLHLGHKYCIETAMEECELVHVILFFGGADEEKILKENFGIRYLSLDERKEQLLKLYYQLKSSSTNYKYSYDGVKYIFQYKEPIKVYILDVSQCRLPNGEEDWDAETPLVRNIVGPELNAVYSSEPSYGEYFSRAYPEAEHRLVDVKRLHYPISATVIRNMTSEKDRKEWMI